MNSQYLKRVSIELVARVKQSDWSSVRIILSKAVFTSLNVPLLPLGLLFTLALRMIRPWLLIRIGILTSERLGHFAANTELYLCERDASINVPGSRFVDIWYHNWPVCNRQLARMWGSTLHVGPRWLLAAVDRANSLIPGGDPHKIGESTASDRDVHNLLDRFPPHLSFLPEEVARGRLGLQALGIPNGAPYVCLIVRDNAYLKRSLPWRSWDYHDHRNGDIQKYVLAAKELTTRGYYVVRMGAAVNRAIDIEHPMIIDYATNGMRTDFMDIYLGANCEFAISNSTGFDAVPYIFRRPIVYVDHVPVGILMTFRSQFLATTKQHWLRGERRPMTLTEIFKSGAAYFYYADQYDTMGVDLIESSPEEISAVVLEMETRLGHRWQTTDEDEALQRRFWDIYSRSIAEYNIGALHGDIRSRVGCDFLRRNKAILR